MLTLAVPSPALALGGSVGLIRVRRRREATRGQRGGEIVTHAPVLTSQGDPKPEAVRTGWIPARVKLVRMDPGRWIDNAADWSAFFEAVAGLTGTDVIASLRALALVNDADVERFGKLRRSANGVALPGLYATTDADVALLALGFGRGQPGDLAVPYARRADA
jgi:hypothetical protein